MENCSVVADVAALGETARCRCLCCTMSKDDAVFMAYFITIITLISWV